MKSHFKLFIILAFASCKVKGPVTALPTTNIAIDSTIVENDKVKSMIEPYTQNMAAAMDEVIGFSPAFLEKKKPTSILGSFMAEAVYQAASATGERVDFCLLNYGGIRSTLDSGEITVGEVFKLMPFENEITILTLSKVQLDTLFKIIAAKGGEPFVDHLWKDQTAYHILNRTAYRVATNDYMANGGDDYSILTEAPERIDTGIKIRDALITFVKNNNAIPLEYKPSKN